LLHCDLKVELETSAKITKLYNYYFHTYLLYLVIHKFTEVAYFKNHDIFEEKVKELYNKRV